MDIKDVKLLVDGGECTLFDFIQSNVIDEPQITLEELKNVVNLNVGEKITSGMVEVERIK